MEIIKNASDYSSIKRLNCLCDNNLDTDTCGGFDPTWDNCKSN